jgi:hypothetical protein
MGMGFHESTKSLGNSILIAIIFILLLLLVPGAITVNFIISILEIVKVIPPLHRKQPKVKEIKKKMPKRRKDFK